MREARLKMDDRDVVYHLYNRVAGMPEERPFGPDEKAHFINLLAKLDDYYCITILSFAIMSNHFHLVVHAPASPPDRKEVCRRYAVRYPNRKPLLPEDSECTVHAERMRDISWLMHDLQQQFTTWFNRTRTARRRGGLWAGRFKHTILTNTEAAWHCMRYVEMNPVRARLVQHPEAYRYCSLGVWSRTGRHPFIDVDCFASLQRRYSLFFQAKSIDQLFGQLAQSLAGQAIQDVEQCTFHIHPGATNRYWTDGLAIGAENDLVDISANHNRKNFAPVSASSSMGHHGNMWCLKKLRSVYSG